MKRLNKRGFTLAELLIVVAIIGVLAAIAIPVFTGSLKRTEETVCLSNRTSLAHEMIYARMMDPEVNLEQIMTEAGIQCPTKGTYSIRTQGNGLSIGCSNHTQTIPQKVISDVLSGAKDWKKTEEGQRYGSNIDNDSLRNYVFKNIYNNAWPILQIDGKDNYIQPYCTKSGDTWLFARGDNSSAGGWSVCYVYEPESQQWYQTSNGKGANVKFDSITDLQKSIETSTIWNGNKMWIPLTNYTELMPEKD